MRDEESLTEALRAAVKALDFGSTADYECGGEPLRHFPSLDLAVIVFRHGRTPVAANVLYSREHPEGLVAARESSSPGRMGSVTNIRFDADQTDAQGNSVAWRPDADWSRMRWTPLGGQDEQRVVAPYPASLLKLMVAVGVGVLVDQGRARWGQALTYGGRTRTLAEWGEDMIVVSCNDATSALVALLHACGAIARGKDGREEVRNEVEALLHGAGLTTLRLRNTRSDGGWGNAAGAGVGHIHMTAWDTARLLWLLDPQAPRPPWLSANEPPLLREATRDRLLAWLHGQGLHEVLSSTALAGMPGWVRGIPAVLPERWVGPSGDCLVAEHHYPANVRPENRTTSVHFAHKTGNTTNYTSDAGIVSGQGFHYIVALLSNLGSRYAPDPRLATTWRVPALGAAIHAAVGGLIHQGQTQQVDQPQ